MEQEQHNIKLGGLDVSFPYKAYGIQKAMLAKIIVALSNKEHALIESPTGTGKSLSLLCSTLAWRLKSKNDQRPFMSSRLKADFMEKRRERLESRPCSCGRRPNARTEADELREQKGKKGCKGQINGCHDENSCDSLKESAPKKIKKSNSNENENLTTSPYFPAKKPKKSNEVEFILIESDSDDDNKVQTKIEPIDINTDTKNGIKSEVEVVEEKTNPGSNVMSQSNLCKNCQAINMEDLLKGELGKDVEELPYVGRIPKIYYGTRTHKQIAQVVRELKKTSYTKNLKMNILSSRDRTCINDVVREAPDRNDKCQELVRNKSKNSRRSDEVCPFYKDTSMMTIEFSHIYEDYDAWDIEDSVTFGRKTRLCPYYGQRALQEDADITFCPYNYLLDANIRSALQISLKDTVIILDEAHNIEDICRDSASFILDTQQIDDLLTSINRVTSNFIQGSLVHDAYSFFRNQFTDLKAFLVRFKFSLSDEQKDGDTLARHIMTHQEMLNSLQLMNLGQSRLAEIKDCLKSIRGDDDHGDRSKKDDADTSALASNDVQIITQMVNTLDFIYAEKSKQSTDFRCIVSKHLEKFKPSARKVTNGEPAHIFRVSLICMNSGIAFKKIHEACWSVIVASGTLSPIESLKTELGCHFKQIFEGSHVIEDDRISASILSFGPKRYELNCSYGPSQQLPFQDEVGSIVEDICKTVPNGVLIFFPSYDRMEVLYQRWFTTRVVKNITETGKKIFREQRNFTALKFEDELKKYYKSATSSRGAVMMAVYRGKVSEGVDFSDSAARAVITIGIPYPNVKEVTIGLKQNYNDEARRTRPELMTGRDWYGAQAFRALNQATGRVIRHKGDWGAIIMVDSRLRYPSSLNNISKWIRRCIKTPEDYAAFRSQLLQFVEARIKSDADPENKMVVERRPEIIIDDD